MNGLPADGPLKDSSRASQRATEPEEVGTTSAEASLGAEADATAKEESFNRSRRFMELLFWPAVQIGVMGRANLEGGAIIHYRCRFLQTAGQEKTVNFVPSVP
jgi:hypothetical protein